MRLAVLAALAAALPLAAPASAQDGMQAGMWEMTSITEMPGMPAMKQAHRQCFTQADLADKNVAMPADVEQSGCKMTEQGNSGSTFRYKMVCADGQVMTGQVTYTNGGYTGSNVMTMSDGGETMTIKSSVVAKRIGDCTK